MLACTHIEGINENEAPRKVFRARKGEVKKRREKVVPSEFHDLALREIFFMSHRFLWSFTELSENDKNYECVYKTTPWRMRMMFIPSRLS